MTRIVLAEDGEDYAAIIKTILTNAGFTLEWHKTGTEAYAALKKGELPTLLITDVMMPGMTGFELMTRLRADGRLPKTIVLTSRQSEEDIVRGLETGALDYIAKPFSPMVLLVRVKKALALP